MFYADRLPNSTLSNLTLRQQDNGDGFNVLLPLLRIRCDIDRRLCWPLGVAGVDVGVRGAPLRFGELCRLWGGNMPKVWDSVNIWRCIFPVGQCIAPGVPTSGERNNAAAWVGQF